MILRYTLVALCLSCYVILPGSSDSIPHNRDKDKAVDARIRELLQTYTKLKKQIQATPGVELRSRPTGLRPETVMCPLWHQQAASATNFFKQAGRESSKTEA